MTVQLGLGAEHILTLTVATVIIAILLVGEHQLTAHLKWPRQYRYAEGLVTVLGGLMVWAALERITVTWDAALLLLAAGCLSGVPDMLILRGEQVRERAAHWQQLAAVNEQWAARLALMQQLSGGPANHAYHRLQDLAESLSFALGTAKLEIGQLDLFLKQATPILEPIIKAAGMPDGDGHQPE